MGKPKLTLFLDVISPFAYIAFYVTRVSSGISLSLHSDMLDMWKGEQSIEVDIV